MKKITYLCLPLLMAVVLVTMPTAATAITFRGEVDTTRCVVGNGVWVDPGPTRLSWVISRDDAELDSFWRYSYTLSVPQGPITHWILELTPGVTAEDIFNLTPDIPVEVRLFKNDDPTTPGMPADIYGIDFQNVNELTQTFTFETTAGPVWGDFYARDGDAGGRDNFAYNLTFAWPDPTDDPCDGSLDCKILRPDTQPGPVIPEPSSIMLGVMGMLPFIAAGRKRRRS